LGYTAANICMRRLAALEADEMLVIGVKELVTVAVVGPYLLARVIRGEKVFPPWRTLAILMAAALAVQLGGNLPVQWAFGVVGLAITMPAVFGTMLTAAALFGFFFLGERVPKRSLAAILLLIGSVGLLNMAADEAHGSLSRPLVLLGVGAGCLGGVTFATLSTAIRFTATTRVPIATIVFVTTLMGVLSLGSLSIWRLGSAGLIDTRPDQWTWMLAAGACNLAAFLAITKGLQLTTLVHANVLNASQVAMGAIAGIRLFDESWNVWLLAGVLLTIVGVILVGQPSPDIPAAEHA
jgi:drug/metabolite transporter (DMT)-like permease